MVFSINHGEGGSEQVRYVSLPQDDVLLTGEREKNAPFSTYLRTNEPLEMPVVGFLLWSEYKVKLEDLGLELDINIPKSGF